MAVDTKVKEKAEETKAKEPKDDRPNCAYCGQKFDVDKAPQMKDKMPIPAAKAKLIASEQAKGDEAIADVERAKLRRMKIINKFARARRLAFRLNMDVEEDPREKDHKLEYFFRDPMDPTGATKVYLGVAITKDQAGELTDLSWDLGEAVEKMEDANNGYKEVLRAITNELGWSQRPILMDRGHFIAPSIIDDVKKETEERITKKFEKDKCKR